MVKKPNLIYLFFAVLSLSASTVKAQKVESIYFNLYTDSLKKGVYNYINVDGKYSSGRFLPLMADEVIFSSTGGKWEGNSIIIDSSFCVDSVVITAKLKSDPAIAKSVVIYLKKFEANEKLKSEEELLNEIRNNRRKKNLVRKN